MTDPKMLADAEVICSELVSNAVRAGGGTIFSAVDLHRYALRITVVDQAPGWPTLQSQSADRTRGRGLQMIQALTTAWGVTPIDAGKQVWAMIELPERVTADLVCLHQEQHQ